MIKISLMEAEGDLARLVDEAAQGEEVIILREDGASFQLLPFQESRSGGAENRSTPIGGALDSFIGTWSAEEEKEFLEAVKGFEGIDESFWS
ncbi:MAG TPA: hypothetical protein VMW27_01895 [Thermoanaerobaculia bacterium]|nr:hypothetical protein [Thermoanaerobaculia bacterium]